MTEISAVPQEYGWVLTRSEEAAFAGGRDLASLDVPPPERDGPATATHWERWQRAHGVVARRSGWFPAPAYVFPPYDHVPDRRTAAWWVNATCPSWPGMPGNRRPLSWEEYAALEAPSVEFAHPSPKPAEIKAAARAAASDPDRPGPPPSWPSVKLAAGTEIATWLALRGPGAVFDVAQAGSRPPAMLLGWVPQARAYLAPRWTSAERDELLALARDSTELSSRRVMASALVAPADEHAGLVAALDPPTFTQSINRRMGVDLDLLVAAAVALVDLEDRRALTLAALEAAGSWGAFPRPDPVAVAAFGEPALLQMVEQTCAQSNQSVADQWARLVLGRLEGPAAVPVALRLATRSKAVGVARDWLLSHEGLLDATTCAGAEREFLDRVRAELSGAATSPTPAAVSAARPAPDWWTKALAREEAAGEPADDNLPKRPAPWLEGIAPISVDGVPLDAAEHDAVIASALRGPSVVIGSKRFYEIEPRPLVAAVRERMSGAERDRIGIALLDGWLDHGASTRFRAYFVAAGFLGADGFVAHLAERAAGWPAKNLRARAELAHTVIAATGRASAVPTLMTLTGTPTGGGFVAEPLRQLAHFLGLSTQDLINASVPDLGFDERGTRRFDFGPRAFRAAIGLDGRITVRVLDADGRPTGARRSGLPAPNAKDDAGLAATVKRELAAVRKSLTSVVRSLRRRLESGMINGQVWEAPDHETYVARHPIVGALTQALVWQVVAPDGEATLVRISEDRDYLTVDEEPYVAPAGALVRLPHPLHLGADDLAAWRAHLVDHDLVQPFDQVDRVVAGLPEGQMGTELADLPTGEVHPGTLVSTFEKDGWVRDHADQTVYVEFPAAQVLVVATVTGLIANAVHLSAPQQVLSVVATRFADGHQHRHAAARLTWSEVDPLIVSEVRRTLAALAAKAQ